MCIVTTATIRHHANQVNAAQAEQVTKTVTAKSKRVKKNVLLQTATAFAFNESNSESEPVRILFDNGSQLSYVTSQLKSRLRRSEANQNRDVASEHLWSNQLQKGEMFRCKTSSKETRTGN